jgi:hypothetical protein
MHEPSKLFFSLFGPIFGPLLEAAPLNELGAGEPDAAAEHALRAISLAEAFAPHEIAEQNMADACLAGLWLMYDYLDESHSISQSIDTPTGSYWHAIMHRREGDFDNAKYWFHRVGKHPIFATLAGAGKVAWRELSRGPESDRGATWFNKAGEWDPFGFVDWCAGAAQRGYSANHFGRLIQQGECHSLFAFCYRQAIDLS